MHYASYSIGSATVTATMRQPWHTDKMLKAGHPAIWKDGKLFEEACRWLNDEIVPIRPSTKTWAQAAQSLLTWLDFLEEVEVDWRYASRADLVAYRDAYLSAISPQTGKEYSPNTIAVRMTYIIDFIRFAVEHEWIDSDLRTGPVVAPRQVRRAPIDEDALAHIRKGSPSSTGYVTAAVARLNKLKPRSGQDDKIKVLSREDLATLLRWAGPRPSERKSEDGGSDRDFIVLALGWACGLRVQEIPDLSILPILQITASSDLPGRMHKLCIAGKGKKIRMIDMPGWLVLDIHAYIEGERKRTLRKRGQRAEESQLILNSEHSSRPGKPMTKSAMQDLMERACIKTGLLITARKANLDTGEIVFSQACKYSMHCLRHTYAVMTYHNHSKSGYSDLEAWKYVQMQLGHKSLKTTILTYLKHISVWADYRAGRSLLQMIR